MSGHAMQLGARAITRQRKHICRACCRLCLLRLLFTLLRRLATVSSTQLYFDG